MRVRGVACSTFIRLLRIHYLGTCSALWIAKLPNMKSLMDSKQQVYNLKHSTEYLLFQEAQITQCSDVFIRF